MADVAARAGVSVATGSRALTGEPLHVSAPVLRRILDGLPTGAVLNPPLAVVQPPTYRVAARAASLLIRRLSEPEAAIRELVLAANLVIRGSTAHVRSV